MSRTVPAVTDKYVVAIGPKCDVSCLDAVTGREYWLIDMVRRFGATVPPWYAGQCPLVDRGRAILAPGGSSLLVALDCRSGQVVWKSPNPRGWTMTHSSIMPMEFAGKRMYVYCGKGGVAGVSADDGSILWDTTDWKISIATVPSPVILPGGKIFLSGGYNAGAMMLQLEEHGGKIAAKTLRQIAPAAFGSTQHTPIFCDGHLYGVREKRQAIGLPRRRRPRRLEQRIAAPLRHRAVPGRRRFDFRDERHRTLDVGRGDAAGLPAVGRVAGARRRQRLVGSDGVGRRPADRPRSDPHEVSGRGAKGHRPQ